MNNHTFENLLGERLREARVPAPAGAWQAIQAGISSQAGSATGHTISFWLSSITALVMLTALSLYSEMRPIDVAQAEAVAISPAMLTEAVQPVANTEPVRSIDIPNGALEPAVITESVEPKLDVNEAAPANISPVGRLEADAIKPISLTELAETSVASPSQSELALPLSLQNRQFISKPEAKISAASTKGYAPFTVQLSNTGQASRNKWYWNASEKIGDEVSFNFDQPGIYRISLMAENEAGIEASDEIRIEVLEPSSFDMPNSFSPNGDGLNETYGVSRALHIEEFTMLIIDDRGNTVFQTKNVSEMWNYDASMISSPDARLFVNYRAVGSDGVVHARVMMPLTVIR